MKQRGMIITSSQNLTQRSEPRSQEPHAEPGHTGLQAPGGGRGLWTVLPATTLALGSASTGLWLRRTASSQASCSVPAARRAVGDAQVQRPGCESTQGRSDSACLPRPGLIPLWAPKPAAQLPAEQEGPGGRPRQQELPLQTASLRPVAHRRPLCSRPPAASPLHRPRRGRL